MTLEQLVLVLVSLVEADKKRIRELVAEVERLRAGYSVTIEDAARRAGGGGPVRMTTGDAGAEIAKLRAALERISKLERCAPLGCEEHEYVDQTAADIASEALK
jgi:hypothetical protein